MIVSVIAASLLLQSSMGELTRPGSILLNPPVATTKEYVPPPAPAPAATQLPADTGSLNAKAKVDSNRPEIDPLASRADKADQNSKASKDHNQAVRNQIQRMLDLQRGMQTCFLCR